MCLLLIAHRVVPHTPLLLLGNRDEYHQRASAAAAPWSEDARIAGGRDLVAGGAWLAVRSDGRFAAVTNLRTGLPATAPKSRGWLVRDFVLGAESVPAFLDRIRGDIESYGPFNLVLGDHDGAFVLGSADGYAQRLRSGIHVISNGAIGVHWPKTEHLQRRFAHAVAEDPAPDSARLLDLLVDESHPPDDALPDTGVGLELERLLSPIFIRGETYGTRAGTLVERNADGRVLLRERRFGPNGVVAGESHWAAHADAEFVEGH
jgi:uncharacterized protein with NRDE domain